MRRIARSVIPWTDWIELWMDASSLPIFTCIKNFFRIMEYSACWFISSKHEIYQSVFSHWKFFCYEQNTIVKYILLSKIALIKIFWSKIPCDLCWLALNVRLKWFWALQFSEVNKWLHAFDLTSASFIECVLWHSHCSQKKSIFYEQCECINT